MSIRPFALERFYALHEFTAPHMLSASDCESLSIAELLELAGASPSLLTELRLGYTESQGDPELRRAIASHHGDVEAEHVVVTNAPEEGIFLVMTALLAPGDQVVVLTPCYQSLRELATHHGCQVVPWPLLEQDGRWQLDMDRLQALLTPSTRLLVINFPHNPTGFLPSREQFKAIVDLAVSRGVPIFSDEMYRGLERTPAEQLPSAVELTSTAISLWGMSKSFGLPGLRIGWLVVPDAARREALMRMKDYTTICNSAPGEVLARAALLAGETFMQRNRRLIDANLKPARELAERWSHLLSWREPMAGPVAFVRLLELSAARFCEDARLARGVLLVPSTLFDLGDSHVRFGLGRQGVPLALAALEEFLHEL